MREVAGTDLYKPRDGSAAWLDRHLSLDSGQRDLLLRRKLPHCENRAFGDQAFAAQIVVPCEGFSNDGGKGQRQRGQEEVDCGSGEVIRMTLSVEDHGGEGGDHQDDASDIETEGEYRP